MLVSCWGLWCDLQDWVHDTRHDAAGWGSTAQDEPLHTAYTVRLLEWTMKTLMSPPSPHKTKPAWRSKHPQGFGLSFIETYSKDVHDFLRWRGGCRSLQTFRVRYPLKEIYIYFPHESRRPASLTFPLPPTVQTLALRLTVDSKMLMTVSFLFFSQTWTLFKSKLLTKVLNTTSTETWASPCTVDFWCCESVCCFVSCHGSKYKSKSNKLAFITWHCQ